MGGSGDGSALASGEALFPSCFHWRDVRKKNLQAFSEEYPSPELCKKPLALLESFTLWPQLVWAGSIRSRAGEGCGHRGHPREHGWHSWDLCARGIQAPWHGSRQGSVGTACPGCASSPELPCLLFRITTSTRRQRCRQPWLCPSLRTEADPSPCPGSFWALQEPSGAPLLPLFHCNSHLVEEGGACPVVPVSEQRAVEQGWDHSLDWCLISVLGA